MSLVARDLSFLAGEKRLLDRVSLDLELGTMLAVLGPNGAGKSTLLKLLTGEQHPSEGTIELDEVPLTQMKGARRARTVAVLPQASSLTFPFPVLEVVLLGRLPHARHSSHEHDEAVAWECLRRVEGAHLAHRPYPTLSGGEKQRVHLARVMAQIEAESDHPRYLLLDEPTSALDLAHQHLVLQTAKQFTARNVGVLAVLHDLNLAAQYADRILILCDGKRVQVGTPAEVLTESCVREVYGLDSTVICHPKTGCPHLIPHPATAAVSTQNNIHSSQGVTTR
jgi:iron complex transport system ATP-binding protein